MSTCTSAENCTRWRKRRAERIADVADRCGLSKLRRRTIGRLSKGNRQRVGLAAALLHEPPVLVLDEPTSGLDPNQIGHVRQLIRELAGKHTVLLSSHLLPEVQRVADRVVIIAQGKVVADGTTEELTRQSAETGGSKTIYLEAKSAPGPLRQRLETIDGVTVTKVQALSGDSVGWCQAELNATGGQDPRAAVAESLSQAGVLVRELRRETGSMEAFFVRVTDVENNAQPTAKPGGTR